MNPSTLTQFLVDVTRGHRQADFARDPAAVLATAALDEPTRLAIQARDIGALWRAGAHPMALLYFARGSGWSNEQYYACIGAAQATRAAPAAACPAAADAPPRTRR